MPVKKYLVTKKELRPYFIYSDGGRWASKEKAITKNGWVGDCAVRTFVHATGTEYQKVKRTIKRLGYSTKNGWDYRLFDFLNNYIFFGHEGIPIKVWGRGLTTTTKSFLDTHPKGAFILRASNFYDWGHIFYVKNGRIFDTFIKDMWVTHAWQIKPI